MRKMKKVIATLSLCAMAMSLLACGDKEKKETTTEATTEEATTEEATTEETTTEETTTEETTTEDATLEDASSIEMDEDGRITLQGLSIIIPDGYEYSDDDSAEGSATFVNRTNVGALVIGVDNQNVDFDDSNVVETFDAQIKVPYGEDITYSSVNYNGHDATEWVLDNVEEGYVGRSLVICDGNMLIYIEYISYEGNLSPYDEAVNSIEY